MGRPKIQDESLRRINQTHRLPRYVSDWLDRQDESAGVLIEQALIEFYKIENKDVKD